MASSFMTASEHPEVFPLRAGDSRTFECAERALRAAGFDEDSVCRALGLESLSELSATLLDKKPDEQALGSTPLGPLVRVFLFLEPVTHDALAKVVDTAALDALLALDLLRRDPSGGGRYYAPVLLYPVGGMLIASDRHRQLDGSPLTMPPDWVFPAFYPGTIRFLRVLPRHAARDVLDLGSGTGIGALVQSRAATRVVAADIAARAAHFASFNARLNRSSNVDVVRGDLYEPVEGRTFDRIIAHPPYVPAVSETRIVFRDGGETGEAILARIVAGLPQFLESGGTFHAVCFGWDAKDGPFESRVRRWLGGAEQQFDLVFAVHHQLDAGEVARGLAERDRLRDQGPEGDRWGQVFANAGVERSVYGALVLRRSEGRGAGGAGGAGRRTPVTRRLSLSPLSDGASFTWLWRWLGWREAAEASGEFGPQLLGLTARLTPRFQVNVAYVPREGGLGVSDMVLGTDRPFGAATRVDPWLLPLVSLFDASRSNEAVYQQAREAGILPDGVGTGDFVRLLALMFEHGYLEASAAPWGEPPRQEPR
jgi:methylase of polypeptide subunit release factors